MANEKDEAKPQLDEKIPFMASQKQDMNIETALAFEESLREFDALYKKLAK